jgi:hypothetical protein
MDLQLGLHAVVVAEVLIKAACPTGTAEGKVSVCPTGTGTAEGKVSVCPTGTGTVEGKMTAWQSETGMAEGNVLSVLFTNLTNYNYAIV